MKALKRRDPQTWHEIGKLLDQIELSPDIGYELRGEWAGCLAAHCGRDKYRVIWEVLDSEDDYTDLADMVTPISVLKVGPKTDSRGRTIYEQR